ncbi:MAG: HEAT repeat domain-containing protein [Candidatus Rokuibacteriota bacterium]
MCAGVLVLAWCSLVSAVDAAPLSSTSAALAGLTAQAKDGTLDPAERVQAIEVLGKWATAEVRDPLIELLKDPAPEIRAAAAKGLGWPGNIPAIGPLSQIVLDKTGQSTVREAAVGALVKIADKSVRQLVIDASREPNAQIREEALRGLVGGPMESGSDLLALATRAAEDGQLSPPFRADAIRRLTSTRDPTALATLVKILETGPRAKIVPPPPNATQSQILAVRYQQIGDVRAWAAQGLGELGDRSVLPKLVTATEDPDDFFLRYVAAGALVTWRAGPALPAFLKLLNDPVSEVRAMAVVGVGTVGDASHVDVLAARLNDDNITVRVSAAEALATIGGGAGCPKLKAAYGQEVHTQVRQALEAALARLKCSLG